MNSKRIKQALDSTPNCFGPYERRAGDIITRQVFRNGKVVYERLEKTYEPHQETSTMGSLIDFDAMERRERENARKRAKKREQKQKKGTQQ